MAQYLSELGCVRTGGSYHSTDPCRWAPLVDWLLCRALSLVYQDNGTPPKKKIDSVCNNSDLVPLCSF